MDLPLSLSIYIYIYIYICICMYVCTQYRTSTSIFPILPDAMYHRIWLKAQASLGTCTVSCAGVAQNQSAVSTARAW